MNIRDHHYFNSLDEIGRPFYDWERQIINLGCRISDINIADSGNSITEEGQKNTSKLVHEYIHFLQNFATAWGAPVFTDLALAIMKIGASSVESQELIDLPLIKSNLKNTLLIDGFNLRESVNQRINKFNLFQLNNSGVLSEISQLGTNEDCIVLTNGLVTTNLGLKVIREHMAHMGTQLFLGKTDNEIHNYNKTLVGFKDNGIDFSKQSEYWIVFEYFHSKNIFLELAKGIFHLMQQCLITLNPEKALVRFFNWYNKQSVYSSRVNFVQVVEDWLKDNNEINYLHLGLTKSIEHCENILELAKRHLGEHDLFLFTYNIANFALNNIKKTTGGRFLFNPNDNFQDINYWKQKILDFGTGIIRYTDGTLIHGTSVHCNKMMDSFSFLCSSSLIIRKIVDNQISSCPFLDDIPICNAEYKGDNNCYRNPFLVIRTDNSGKECLFRNGVLLTGMQDRINFCS